MFETLKARLRKPLPAATPATLRGYHGGTVAGEIIYASDDFAVAERYGDNVVLLEYHALRPLLLQTAEEARGVRSLAQAFAGGHAGHDHLGAWARAQGYDALVLTAAARAGLGASGFGEMLFLDPERVTVIGPVKAHEGGA